MCPFPQVGVTDGIWQVDLEDSSQAVINECLYFYGCVFVVLQVYVPYNRTGFTLELKSLIFVLWDNSLELQMFLSCKNALLAFPSLAFTPASVPPCLPIVLPR